MEKKSKVVDMKQDLRSWGIGLIIVGIISQIFSGFFSSYWGVILILIGLVTLFIQEKKIYLLIGGSLVIVGLLNIIIGEHNSLIAGGQSGWAIFGMLQIYWGVKEFRKYWNPRVK